MLVAASYAPLSAVVGKWRRELQAALGCIRCGWFAVPGGRALGVTYLLKHALVQDVADGTLLREPRRLLHARIADVVESRSTAQSLTDVLARDCTEVADQRAAGQRTRPGQRSLACSALVEAAEQLKRALSLIATLPATTPALRREEIKLEVALITPLIHVKGYSAPETKATAERARLLIEQAEALGEPLEDPLLLYSVLYGIWVTNYIAFNGDICRDLAAHVLSLAERQGATVPLMVGHRVMGATLLSTGDFSKSRAHFDAAFALYDPVEHRPLATRFGQDAVGLFFGRNEDVRARRRCRSCSAGTSAARDRHIRWEW